MALAGEDAAAWTGQGIINLDAAGQNCTVEAVVGKSAIFEVLIRQSEVSDQILVQADEPDEGWKARYFYDGKEITSAITGAGWLHRFLSTEDARLRLEVTPPPGLSQDARKEFALHTRSVAPFGRSNEDVVEATVVAHGKAQTATPKPDLSIQLAWEEDFVGGGVFQPNGAGQEKSATVPFKTAQSFFIKTVNNGPAAGPLLLHGAGTAAGWTAKYFDGITGKNDITEQMTGAGWSTPTLEIGASQLLRVDLNPTITARTDQEFLVTVALTTTPSEKTRISDGVKAVGVLPQYVTKLQYRTDDMPEGWYEIPEAGVEISPLQTVTFHALKGKPDLEWPFDPDMKPKWISFANKNNWLVGEQVTYQFEKANTDKTLYLVEAECGTEAAAKVRVVNKLKAHIWAFEPVLALQKDPKLVETAPKPEPTLRDLADPDYVEPEKEPDFNDSTMVYASIFDSYRHAVPGLKMRFTMTGGSGEINGPGTADDEGITNAKGECSFTFHAGKSVGTVHITATVGEVPETMRLTKMEDLEIELKDLNKKMADTNEAK